MTKFPPLQWTREPDNQRPGAWLWSASLADSYVIVQEVSIGEWGWQLCDLDGNVVTMSNDFSDAENCKAAFQSYVEEYGQ